MELAHISFEISFFSTCHFVDWVCPLLGIADHAEVVLVPTMVCKHWVLTAPVEGFSISVFISKGITKLPEESHGYEENRVIASGPFTRPHTIIVNLPQKTQFIQRPRLESMRSLRPGITGAKILNVSSEHEHACYRVALAAHVQALHAKVPGAHHGIYLVATSKKMRHASVPKSLSESSYKDLPRLNFALGITHQVGKDKNL